MQIGHFERIFLIGFLAILQGSSRISAKGDILLDPCRMPE